MSDYEALTGSSDHDQFNNSIPRPESSFPPADASTFVPSEPMTAAQISQARFSTPSEANNIALANGNLPLDHVYPAQSIVNIPDLRVALSGSDSSVAISIMMQAMKGSLSPHVTFAPIKHKHHCVEKIIHIVIQIVSVLVALNPAMSILSTALEAGVLDMSMQAAAKAAHLIKHFNWVEVLDTALSAGMQAGFNGASFLQGTAHGFSTGLASGIKSFAKAHWYNMMLVGVTEQATMNVATQFANMAVGAQKQFDLKSVFDTMVVSILDFGVQSVIPLPMSANPGLITQIQRAVIRDIEVTAESVVADAIVGGSVDLESAALSGLGAAVSQFGYDMQNPSGMQARPRVKQSAHSNQHGAHHLEESGHGVHHDYHQHHDAGRGIAYAETGLPNEPGAWHDAFEEGMSLLNNTSNRAATDINHQLSTSVTHADAYHASRMADSWYNEAMSVLNSDPDTLQHMAYHNETHQGPAANATNHNVTINSHTGTPKPHTNDLLPNRGNTTEDVGDWIKSKLSLFGAKLESFGETSIRYDKAFWGGVVDTGEDIRHLFTVNGLESVAAGISNVGHMVVDDVTGNRSDFVQRGMPIVKGVEDQYHAFMQANGPDRVEMATHLGSSMVAMFGAGKAVSVLGDVGRGIALDTLSGGDLAKLDPAKVRFSQRWVSYSKVRGSSSYTYSDIVRSMKANGWDGPPIDVVRMPDGSLTSIDNTRVLAARDAGIKLQARVWNHDERLPDSMAGRFENQVTGQYANNWGEAIDLRILKQPEQFILSHYPYGSLDDPMIYYNSNTNNITLR